MTSGQNVVVCLLQAQADVDHKTQEGWTALHLAVKGQRSEIAARLLEQHCLGSVKDGQGRTPLHWAANQADAKLFFSLCREPSCVCHDADAKGTSRYQSKLLRKAHIYL